MRPQEDFYYYDASTGQCVNFPYTGACRIQPAGNNGYHNVFPSYDECILSSIQPQSQYPNNFDHNFPGNFPTTNIGREINYGVLSFSYC